MTRATETLITGAIIVVIYLALFFGFLPLPEVIQDKIVPVLPWWALVSFGSYSLGYLGWHIMTFSDCPEAYTELMNEIDQAKIDLRSKGVSI